MKRHKRLLPLSIGLILAAYSLAGCAESAPTSGWTDAGTLLDARSGHSATRLDDGAVLFIGGENARGLVASTELRDTAKKQWSLRGSLNEARKEHAAVKRNDGHVIVIGGKNVTGLSSCIEVYNPDNRQFVADPSWTGNCPEQPWAAWVKWSIHKGVWPDGTSTEEARLVIADRKTGELHAYDTSSNAWIEPNPVTLMAPRAGFSATVLTREQRTSVFDIPDGGTGADIISTDRAILLVVGGAQDTQSQPIAEYLDVEACASAAAKCAWNGTQEMGVNRTNHSATYLGNGEVLVVGGQDDLEQVLKSAELYRYDWEDDQWTVESLPDLNVARYGHSATRLNDGTVLVVGGRDTKGQPLDSVEIYDATDPKKKQFRQSNPMSTPRAEFSTTWLPDGNVLVVGGVNAAGIYLDTAERFVPADGRIACERTEDCPQAMVCGAERFCQHSTAPLELQGSCSYSAAQSSGNAGAVAAMACLLAVLSGRRRRWAKRVIATLWATAGLLVAASSQAQTPTFYLDRLQMSGGPQDGAAVWRPVFGRTGLFGQFALGYAPYPLRAASIVHDVRRAQALDGSPVSLQVTGFATAGIELAQRGAIQVTIPYVVAQHGYPTDNRREGLDEVVNMAPSALGDLRIDARMLMAWNETHTLALALRVAGYLPTGDEYSFTGEGHAWGSVGLSGEYNAEAFFLTANAGLTMRPQSTLVDLTVGPEFTYAVSVYVPLRQDRLRMGAELWGALGLSSRDPEAIPIEGALSTRIALGAKKRIFLGVSAGGRLGIGYAPDMRFVARIGGVFPFTEVPPEPTLPVRLPAAADTDGDGFIDMDDKCPIVSEDKKRELDGCPETDEDNDGIDTSVDACPTVPEDKDGLADEDGCPEDDFDGDGFADIDDKCPREPGVRNEDPAKLGCPQFIERTKTEVRLSKQIEFEFNSATITPGSFPILDEIAKLLKANPDIKQLRIEGHTDNVGDAAFNQGLSMRRAEAVKDYLVQRGKVKASRLTFAGFGQTKPIAPNDTKEGQAKNRRVELHIGGGEGGEEKRP